MNPAPIGVYDSGFGGLTVLRELRRALPQAEFVYLGDAGRAPYGGRDTEVILSLAEQCVERLFSEGCRVVVVACHTVSSVALRHLQARYAGPGRERAVLGVTIPAAELAVEHSSARGARIAFVATARTVASGTFTTECHKLAPVEVVERAAPLLAPIVEEGWEDTDVARLAVRRYVEGLGASVVVLGCTHFPLLRGAFEAALDCPVLDPAPFVAGRLVDWMARHPEFKVSEGEPRFLSTGDPEAFATHGSRFLGAPVKGVQHVAETAGRLEPAARVVPRGQVVRP